MRAPCLFLGASEGRLWEGLGISKVMEQLLYASGTLLASISKQLNCIDTLFYEGRSVKMVMSHQSVKSLAGSEPVVQSGSVSVSICQLTTVPCPFFLENFLGPETG